MSDQPSKDETDWRAKFHEMRRHCRDANKAAERLSIHNESLIRKANEARSDYFEECKKLRKMTAKRDALRVVLMQELESVEEMKAEIRRARK